MGNKSMKTISAARMQALDRAATEKQGIPSIILMENAGRGAAEEIVRMLRRVPKPKVCVVCGSGNNGGDGFVVARHLKIAGVAVSCFLAGESRNLKNDALTQFRILENLNVAVHPAKTVTAGLKKALKQADISVDALFGIGLNREVGEPFSALIHALNACAKKIVSLDVPSGLDATTGRIWGTCIEAHTTVTFQVVKTGLCKREGPKHSGQVVVCHIGTDLNA